MKFNYFYLTFVLMFLSSIPNNCSDATSLMSLHDAAISNKPNIIFENYRMGKNVNQADEKGVTPLALAVIHSSIDAIKALLVCNANPDIPGLYGKTPRELAKGTSYTYFRNLSGDFGTGYVTITTNPNTEIYNFFLVNDKEKKERAEIKTANR